MSERKLIGNGETAHETGRRYGETDREGCTSRENGGGGNKAGNGMIVEEEASGGETHDIVQN